MGNCASQISRRVFRVEPNRLIVVGEGAIQVTFVKIRCTARDERTYLICVGGNRRTGFGGHRRSITFSLLRCSLVVLTPQPNRLCVVSDCAVVVSFPAMGDAATVVCTPIFGTQLERPIIVCDGAV